MDFTDTPDEAQYRSRARAWLAASAPRFELGGFGPDSEEAFERGAGWQAHKAAAGYACITWSKEWGGPGGTPLEHVIFSQEEAAYDLPRNPFIVGLGMCVPTVIAYGDHAARQRFVGPALRGEELWCQLFSEPAAGSDLAGVRTRAVRDGDQWVVNGQKVWTSMAHRADFGLLLTRTDPEVPKHKGLTMFWIDMRAAGVEARPIVQLSGRTEFNEVFLTDVVVPDSQRLGDVGGGWKVALTTLMNERLAVGMVRGPELAELIAFARSIPSDYGTVADDPDFRRRLADWHVEAEGIKFTRFRTMTALSRGQAPGPEASIGKIVSTNRVQDLARYMLEMQNQFGIVSGQDGWSDGIAQHELLSAPGSRIAGGPDEILKNIIAERVLGMPGDIRVDKDVPFSAIPTGR
ncbi:MAG: acyl-CoA dehydrogenase family protein [Candidatus Sphingomonas phytovorans]|nr:acyl-CoA dehydrogenase family protein [Sphingomonas sp.]WEK02245.1 MAG: acyl-CoA dehydrogenase family protein [Sphingomonas sp.]